MLGTSRVAALDALLCQGEAILVTLRANLAVAQEKMKIQADKHKQDRSFEVGDWVYLRLDRKSTRLNSSHSSPSRMPSSA